MVVHNNLDYKRYFIVVVVDKLPFIFEKLVVKLIGPMVVVVLDMLVVHIMDVVVEF